MSVYSKVSKYITENNLIEPGDKIVLGVSGGADSMCLLFLLKKYCDENEMLAGKVQIQAVHVHHGIRGLAADEDAEFAVAECKRYGVNCKIEYVDVPTIAKLRHESVEEAGRNERYRVFRETGADKIAVAAHMNDQAETIIHNMIRGTGIHGLVGMNPMEKKIIRPLLCITRLEIEDFCHCNDINYIEDETNSDITYSRNRIRHNIIPQAVIINSRAVENINSMSGRLKDIEELIDELSRAAIEKYVHNEKEAVVIDRQLFDEEKSIIVKEVIRCCIERLAGKLKDITSDHIKEIIELSSMQSGKRVSLPYKITAIRSYDTIQLIQKKELDECADTYDDTKQTMEITILEKEDFKGRKYPKDTYTKWFDYDKISNGLVLRTRRSGDYISINGGTKKLQDYFTDEKVPAKERDTVNVVADGSEIVWIVGYRIGEKYKVTDDTVRVAKVDIKEVSK